MNCYLQFPDEQYGWVGFGDENESLLDFLQSIIALPESTQAIIAVEHAEGHFYDKNFQLALEELAKASRLAPSGAKVDYSRARVLQEMGDHAEAIELHGGDQKSRRIIRPHSCCADRHTPQ